MGGVVKTYGMMTEDKDLANPKGALQEISLAQLRSLKTESG
jgi:hypothetical protein